MKTKQTHTEYMRTYMKQYYQRNRDKINNKNRERYQNSSEEKKKIIRNNNKQRNIKRYYLHLLSYKYLKQTQPDIITMFRDKLKELINNKE